jgi:putative endonuclease
VGNLEIDLVAQSGPLVVVVEVRTRGAGSLTTALESITAQKRARLLRATERLWTSKLKARQDVQKVRIDVACVTFDGQQTEVEYVEGAVVGGAPG